MTIVLQCNVTPETAQALEPVLEDLAVCNWSLYQDKQAPEALYTLEGFFDTEAEAQEAWQNLLAQHADCSNMRPTLMQVEDKDWQNAYKAYLQPWSTGPLHWVPVWDKQGYAVPSGHVALYLDAGMAFGTGTHETTRLCAQALVGYAKDLSEQDKKQVCVVDAGCGSGILALSAARLGFEKVFAFDNDPMAVTVASENAAHNELTHKVGFAVADLQKGLKPAMADMLMANIQADVLCTFAAELIGALRPGGQLVLSGILVREHEAVWTTFVRQAQAMGCMLEGKAYSMGEWASWVCKRSA
jgi:ribosomal protein L11 methyltransferase